MLFSSICLSVLFSGCLAAPATQQSSTGFVKTKGSTFSLDGKPFYFTGANTYYLFYAQPSDIDQTYTDLLSIDGKVLRTWAWADGSDDGVSYGGKPVYYQEYNNATKTVTYNDDPTNGLGRLDAVVASAQKHGVKLILTLTGNWNAFGGIDWYVKNFGGKYHSDFYTNEEMIKAYTNWMDHVLNHKNSITGVVYKDDPTIMAFELANEPRCVGAGAFPASPSCVPATMTSWVKTVSAHFKSVDKNHLLALGDEGYFNRPNGPSYVGTYTNIWDGSSGNDFDTNIRIPGIDFGSFHSYMDSWNTPNDPLWLNNTLTWISQHASAAKSAGKPVVLGEFGTTNKTQRLADTPKINQHIEGTGIAGDLFWMLGSAYYGKPYPDYDGYELLANDTNIKTLVTNHATIMNARDK